MRKFYSKMTVVAYQISTLEMRRLGFGQMGSPNGTHPFFL